MKENEVEVEEGKTVTIISCELNTDDNCGKPDSTAVVDCNKYGNAAKGICLGGGECAATACVLGYHLVDRACVADSLNACGSATNDCTKKDGWAGGICEDSRCQATHCQANYCLLSEECVAGTSNPQTCGAKGGAEKCIECSDPRERCIRGNCEIPPIECAEDICYRDDACLNGDDRCGYECVDCNTADNAIRGTCDKDSITCTATACETGYHLDEGKCKQDTIKACGSPTNDCTELPGWEPGVGLFSGICTNGQCEVDFCNLGKCIDGDRCVSGQSKSTCGDGGACKACAGNEICHNGKCVECREHGDCQFRGVATGTCNNATGKCVITACKPEYAGDTCVAQCNSGLSCGANETCGGNACGCAADKDKGCGPLGKCCMTRATMPPRTYACKLQSDENYICPP